jgi:hypothetical protein
MGKYFCFTYVYFVDISYHKKYKSKCVFVIPILFAVLFLNVKQVPSGALPPHKCPFIRTKPAPLLVRSLLLIHLLAAGKKAENRKYFCFSSFFSIEAHSIYWIDNTNDPAAAEGRG